VSELWRKEFDGDCSVVSITRVVGHRESKCILGVKDHLGQYVSTDADGLLFRPAREGCQLNDRVFSKGVFKKAAKDVGREHLSAH
jgi:hypothetical protein